MKLFLAFGAAALLAGCATTPHIYQDIFGKIEQSLFLKKNL